MMNELIAKLYDQALVLESNGDYVAGELDPVKFAMLIVKECVEQVWYTREDGINGNISEVIKDRIKQHFGVEE